MINTLEVNKFSDEFDSAQEKFAGQIEVIDRSGLVTSQSDAVRELLMAQEPNQQGFYAVELTGHLLRNDPRVARVLGRIILMPNKRLGALSPAIITRGQEADYDITMLDLPFATKAGFTAGQHFGLSVKAQTRVEGFGGHSRAGAFEAGHFSTVLVGTRDESLAQNIMKSGDAATHQVIGRGVPEAMAETDMLNVPYRTVRLSADNHANLAVFWHPALDTEKGPASGDYPDAVRLMLGAGVAVLGQRGLDDARRLVDYATEGIA